MKQAYQLVKFRIFTKESLEVIGEKENDFAEKFHRHSKNLKRTALPC